MKINKFIDQHNGVLILDNVIDEIDQDNLLAALEDSSFHWTNNSRTSPEYGNLYADDRTYEAPVFTHWIMHPTGETSDQTDIMTMILIRLMDHLTSEMQFDRHVNVMRVKANKYEKFDKPDGKEYHTPHIDTEQQHAVILYFANDSDGDTVFFNNKDKPWEVRQSVSPKKGRIVIFNGLIYHASNNPTQHDTRITVNINVN
jgi:hypothetical protein